MKESQIDLAHTVALGSIGDEDQRAVADLLDTDDAVLRAAFTQEVQQTREAIMLAASAVAVPPPPALRDRLLAAIATDQAPPNTIHRSHPGLHHGNGRSPSPIHD
ncbi:MULTISPECIES: RskA family anti-sigma factor [unclassified Nocardia]|uniref:RskA family anti-sigma factor n=1 Tax=unclassified Nocardia TaxID=2637762 RepID=UPI00367C28D5